MDRVEFILQLLSVVFAILGVIVTVGSIDRRWSLAAVIYRRLCRKDIDWEAEREKWQETYGIDIERASQPQQKRRDGSRTPRRSSSGLTESTAVEDQVVDLSVSQHSGKLEYTASRHKQDMSVQGIAQSDDTPTSTAQLNDMLNGDKRRDAKGNQARSLRRVKRQDSAMRIFGRGVVQAPRPARDTYTSKIKVEAVAG